MAEIKWLDTQVQLKRMYQQLGEVESLTQQLAEAVDREDQVTVQMLLGMREEPIRQLADIREILQKQGEDPAIPDGTRLRELLRGGSAIGEEEARLADQVALNDRLLERVRALDQAVSRRLAREKSVYQ